MPLKLTPHVARWYLLGAALLIAFPSLMSIYTRYNGKILVALSKIERDPYFARTVIFIGEHNGWGAQGIILNQPIPEEELNKLSNLPKGFKWLKGGPVMYPWAQFVLVPDMQEKNEKLKMMTLTQYIKNYPEEWQQVLNSDEKKSHFRIYLGFAGWNMAQLEGEILRGSWGLIPYDADLLNSPESGEEMWRRALGKVLEKAPEQHKEI
ncbi:MAG: YqgE/AlgH family protein [Alphaproteobacteria bacterium]|nr:YqgE/AlgH family protein [Alphaproteobacteria bacterium]